MVADLNEMLEGRSLHVVLCASSPRHVNRRHTRLYIRAARFPTRERQKLGVAALELKRREGETDA